VWVRRARLEAIEAALGDQTDYLSDALDVLRDMRDQLSEVVTNTDPPGLTTMPRFERSEGVIRPQ
jgi:hypothetical protein